MKTHEIALSSATTITTTVVDRTYNGAQEQEHMVDIGGGLALSVATIRNIAQRGWYSMEVPLVGHLHETDDDGEQYPVTSLSLHYIEPWPDPALDDEEDLHEHIRLIRERNRTGAYMHIEIRIAGHGTLIHAWNHAGYAPDHDLCWFPQRAHHERRVAAESTAA